MTKTNVKKIKQGIKSRFQGLIKPNAMLPEFIIIGAQKAGTTSLHAYLGQHPELLKSQRKEVHFFDGGLGRSVDTYKLGKEWYRGEFPERTNINKRKKVFESTPAYIFNPLAAKRIQKMLPKVKLIAVLRNPTDRAISHYFHSQKRGYEPLPILEALKQEESRLEKAYEESDFKNRNFSVYSYKARGRYHEQIARYFEIFSKDQMLILSSNLLFSDTEKALQRVYSFLDINPDFVTPNLKPKNVGRNRVKVDAEVYEYLNEYFEPHNRKLVDLIGEDYGW